ncbi:hypothetical protein PLICRDRAFT_41929 [Plicaturopsis crispa FD-325 SS-3]|nr:hypothetical protein PLICRDRAFT_41929 [Plicaturopsis crispa FD-325 SS-3]
MSNATLPKTRADWLKALDELPSTPDKIPAFFFGHGSPALAYPGRGMPGMESMGPQGPLGTFLRDFGPKLLEKYKPKGIVVFSAHWESDGETLVSDYGAENPLLMDYYGFPPELYRLKFKSRGDSALSSRVMDLYKQAGIRVRTTDASENRGRDGRGFAGPGFDHGVFVPFRIMFGEEFTDIPTVQVSIDGSMSPAKNWALGKAVAKLREEGILVLSGGLLVHNLRDFSAFNEETADAIYKEFDRAILDAITIPDAEARRTALVALTKHRGFRAAQPREDHFVPLYVAAGAGEGGSVKVVEAIYGAPTFAFGL